MNTLIVGNEALANTMDIVRAYTCMHCIRYSDGAGCNGGGADALPSCLDGHFSRNEVRREIDQHASSGDASWLACGTGYTGAHCGVVREHIIAEEDAVLDTRWDNELTEAFDHSEAMEDQFNTDLRDFEWEAWDEYLATLPVMRISRTSTTCHRCGGTGQYGHMSTCFSCEGTGRIRHEAFIRADWKRPEDRLVRRSSVVRDLIQRREVAVLKRNPVTKRFWLLKTCEGFAPAYPPDCDACYELDHSQGYYPEYVKAERR